MEQKPNTAALLSRIEKAKNIKEFCEKNEVYFEERPFAEYISKLCEKKGFVAEGVIKKAQLDRTYGHQLFNGLRKPSRDKVIQLAFGFELELEDTQKLLRAARKSNLYPKVKRDAVIIFAINQKMNIIELEDLLMTLDLPLFGKE